MSIYVCNVYEMSCKGTIWAMSFMLSLFFLILLFSKPVVDHDAVRYIFGISMIVLAIDLLILAIYPNILKEACQKETF